MVYGNESFFLDIRKAGREVRGNILWLVNNIL